MKNMGKIRTKKGMSKEELAVKTETTYWTICSYETGKRVPNVFKAWHIAKALGCTVEQLIK